MAAGQTIEGGGTVVGVMDGDAPRGNTGLAGFRRLARIEHPGDHLAESDLAGNREDAALQAGCGILGSGGSQLHDRRSLSSTRGGGQLVDLVGRTDPNECDVLIHAIAPFTGSVT